MAGIGRSNGGVMNSSRKLTLAMVALFLIWGLGAAPVQGADDSWISSKIRCRS